MLIKVSDTGLLQSMQFRLINHNNVQKEIARFQGALVLEHFVIQSQINHGNYLTVLMHISITPLSNPFSCAINEFVAIQVKFSSLKHDIAVGPQTLLLLSCREGDESFSSGFFVATHSCTRFEHQISGQNRKHQSFGQEW